MQEPEMDLSHFLQAQALLSSQTLSPPQLCQAPGNMLPAFSCPSLSLTDALKGMEHPLSHEVQPEQEARHEARCCMFELRRTLKTFTLFLCQFSQAALWDTPTHNRCSDAAA